MFTCALTADSELRFLEESDAAELYALIDANNGQRIRERPMEFFIKD